jgi:PAS domain S-box-containing protein
VEHVTEHFGRALAGRIDALAAASRALSELCLDFEAALETTIRIVGDFLGDACLLMLLSEDAQTLRVVSVYPSDSEARALIADTHRHPIDIRDGPFGPVVQRRLPLAIPTMDAKRLGLSDSSTRSFHGERHEMQSLVCLPIVAEAKTEGVLAICRPAQGDPFAPGELSLLQTLADRIALTLESARLRGSIQTLAQEREQTLIQLHDIALRSSLLIDATDGCAVFTLDPAGVVMTCHARAQRFQGYDADELLGSHFSRLQSADDIASGGPKHELEAAQTHGSHAQEGWRIGKDGQRFWASIVTTACRGLNGDLIGYGMVIRDITERVRATELFRLALEAAPTGMLLVDEAGRIALANAQVEGIFGYARDELIGKPIELLVPERFRTGHPIYRTSFFEAPAFRPMGAGRELFGRRQDSSELPIEIGLNPVETPQGRFVLCSIVDISERKRGELLRQLQFLNAELEVRVKTRTSELSTALKERELLLQEIHHRVKNNLQVIASLINMQLRRLADVPGRRALEECRARIHAIALVHEMLYQDADYAKVPFSKYAQSLANSIFSTGEVSPAAISLELAIDDIDLPVGKAIPCGLVLNELITNALKYAFPGDRRGTIRVEFAQCPEGGIRLCVSDTGVGLPPDFDMESSTSFGLQLVQMLAEQLDARLLVRNQGGASFQLTVRQ